MTLDRTDRRILNELQDNGRISNVELSRRLNLSPPAMYNRVRKLEERGAIREVVAHLDREQLGFDLLCFVQIRMHVHELQSLTSFKDYVVQLPEVLECHHLTGQYDYLLKVALRNRSELQGFINSKLIPLRGVAQISTSILLEEVKFVTQLPL